MLAGVLDAAGYLLVYVGEERVSGGIAAVVYGTQPLILALLLTATRIERLTRRHVVGAVISLAGVAVLFFDRLDVSPRQAIGVAMVLGSVVVATTYSMVMKRHGQGVHGVVVDRDLLAVTAVVLGVIALVASTSRCRGRRLASPTFALLYLAMIGSVVAFLVLLLAARPDELVADEHARVRVPARRARDRRAVRARDHARSARVRRRRDHARRARGEPACAGKDSVR